MSGWKLSAALLIKQIDKLGATTAQMLAAFDPETATEVDREKLVNQMRNVAQQLAQARQSHGKERDEAVNLAQAIERDESAAVILMQKLDAGQVAEDIVEEFAQNLQNMKERLVLEQQDERDAAELAKSLEEILGTVQQRLQEFDAMAKKVQHQLQMANMEEQRQNLRLEAQGQLQALRSGMGAPKTALDALRQKAEKKQVAAQALAIEADIAQKPLDRQNAVEQAREIANGGGGQQSATERLRASLKM